MRPSTLEQRTFFVSRGPGYRADLFTLSLKDGTTHRWTSLDIPVRVSGETWLAQSPNLELVSLSVRNTTEVPTLEIKLSALDDDFDGGTSIKRAIHFGAFDGARLRYDMLPMSADPFVVLGPPITLFEGPIGEIDLVATGATLKVRGDVVIMSQYAPRNIYQTPCQHRFCDEGCTLHEADFTTFNCTIGGGSTLTEIFWGGSRPADPARAAFGQAAFTSGENAGYKRSILSASDTSFILAVPVWFTAQAGETVDIFYGCDKKLATCTDTYNNRVHFRGFPAIPDASYAA